MKKNPMEALLPARVTPSPDGEGANRQGAFDSPEKMTEYLNTRRRGRVDQRLVLHKRPEEKLILTVYRGRPNGEINSAMVIAGLRFPTQEKRDAFFDAVMSPRKTKWNPSSRTTKAA